MAQQLKQKNRVIIKKTLSDYSDHRSWCDTHEVDVEAFLDSNDDNATDLKGCCLREKVDLLNADDSKIFGTGHVDIELNFEAREPQILRSKDYIS
tara:strand:+ start:1144 stop:1428 length:285 start_codon:yes stop_codon:yes gene_type:complete